jgi:glutamine---fructose-6-phosphate transaminase (isomerizing)
MAREIAEQPVTVARALHELLPLRSQIRDLAAGIRDVLLVARGTSDNAAVYGRYLVEVHACIGASLAAPSLATHYRVERDLSRTLVVSLSQSGNTEEIVATQAWAASLHARTLAITNDPASPLARAADLSLDLGVGTELAVPATKTYTAQLVALAVLADALGPAADTLEPALELVPSEIRRLVATAPGLEEATAVVDRADSVLVSGRGLTYGAALEMALKLEETNLRPVRGLSYADLRHGPMAVLDETVAVVLVSAADGPLVDDLAHLARDVRATGAATIGLGGTAAFRSACGTRLGEVNLPERVAPIALAVPGQQLAERLARHRGLDPDAPRGLSKVTQTDGGAA